MSQPTPKEMLRRAREIAHELNNDEVLHDEVLLMLKAITPEKKGARGNIYGGGVSESFKKGLPTSKP